MAPEHPFQPLFDHFSGLFEAEKELFSALDALLVRVEGFEVTLKAGPSLARGVQVQLGPRSYTI